MLSARRPGGLNKFLWAVNGGKIAEWIPLLDRQRSTKTNRQLLHPSIIHIGDRQDTLASHPCEGSDPQWVVYGCICVTREEDTAHLRRIST